MNQQTINTVEKMTTQVLKNRERSVRNIAINHVKNWVQMINPDGTLRRDDRHLYDAVIHKQWQQWDVIVKLFQTTPIDINHSLDKHHQAEAMTGETVSFRNNQKETGLNYETGFKNFRRYSNPISGWLSLVQDWQLFNSNRDCNRQKFLIVTIPQYNIWSIVKVYDLMVGFPGVSTEDEQPDQADQMAFIKANQDAVAVAFGDWFITHLKSIITHELAHYVQHYKSDDWSTTRENARLLGLYKHEEFTRKEHKKLVHTLQVPYGEQRVECMAFALGIGVFFKNMGTKQAMHAAIEQCRRLDVEYQTPKARNYFFKWLCRVIPAQHSKSIIVNLMIALAKKRAISHNQHMTELTAINNQLQANIRILAKKAEIAAERNPK